MKKVKTLAKRFFPKAVADLLSKFISTTKRKGGRYDTISLTEEEIVNSEYKKHLGGGSVQWDSRGRFQLILLQQMGMVSSSKVLDLGCGPGRASKHLIRFLDKENYCGLDYNASFIEAAMRMTEKEGLSGKNPRLEVIQNFTLDHIDKNFEFALLFSVLNHCDEKQRKRFFLNIHKPLLLGGKVYITHAEWFQDSYLKGTRMKLTKQLEPDDFNITEFGWRSRDDIFPIIELIKI